MRYCGPRSIHDRGEGAVSYLAVVILIAGITLTFLSSGVGGAVADRTQGALCRLFQDDCEWHPNAAGSTSEPSPRAYRAPNQDHPPPAHCPGAGNEYGGCGPPSREEAAANQPTSRPSPDDDDDDGCDATSGLFGDGYCGDFFEVDLGTNQGTVYIYQEASDLIGGLLRDICKRLPGGDEATGRCILAFLRNIQNIPDSRRGDWNNMTDGDRWEDIIDELDELQDGGGCLTVSRSRGPFGDTNWSTRDSGGSHCQPGPDPLAELPQAGALLDILPQDLDPAALRGVLQGLPQDLRGQLEDLVDVDGFLDDLTREIDD